MTDLYMVFWEKGKEFYFKLFWKKENADEYIRKTDHDNVRAMKMPVMGEQELWTAYDPQCNHETVVFSSSEEVLNYLQKERGTEQLEMKKIRTGQVF